MASASLIALAAFGAPTASACSGASLSTGVTGPILSTGWWITVTHTGEIDGAPDGVDIVNCSASVLSNFGTISGGAGSLNGRSEGVGVYVEAQTLTALVNHKFGQITGVAAIGDGTGVGGVHGGAGVYNRFGTIGTLINQGTIRGGYGVGATSGGAGISNGGTITTLINSGIIGATPAGAGVLNGNDFGAGLITTLTNNGTILGGNTAIGQVRWTPS
jgi:hypothetical protein